MTAMADEGAFVFGNPMAGYGAKLTPERPTDDARERGVWPHRVTPPGYGDGLGTACKEVSRPRAGLSRCLP